MSNSSVMETISLVASLNVSDVLMKFMVAFYYYYLKDFQSNKYERTKAKVRTSDWLPRTVVESASHLS